MEAFIPASTTKYYFLPPGSVAHRKVAHGTPTSASASITATRIPETSLAER
jgi:hypothetical protein